VRARASFAYGWVLGAWMTVASLSSTARHLSSDCWDKEGAHAGEDAVQKEQLSNARIERGTCAWAV
jgi:hypothetical protein